MGSSIGFYCADDDNQHLQMFAESLGLIAVSLRIDIEVGHASVTGPYCFLSTVPKSKLHPYGSPPLRLTDAKDPMLGFMRSYFANPYLVAGHIQWSNDVPILAAQTKPYYQDIAQWIKNNWEALPGRGYYIGPRARELVSKGAEMVNVPPGEAEFTLIPV